MANEAIQQQGRGGWLRFALPLGIFAALVILLGVGLTLNPREVPSPLIDKPAPLFELPQLHQPDQTFSPQQMLGKVWMLNVWAAWCVSCREEHPVLVELSKSGVVPIYGLDYKDQRKDGMAWLSQFGNPYQLSAFDANGRVGIDYGVYGVPETYIIDKRGVIRYKHIGILTREVVRDRIVPLVQELNRGA
jgi:cytochrome c biogenesis protein CcmG/thiol:disulfide interchange protein DsbE